MMRSEEVASRYTYPPAYKGAHPIAEQANRLRALFPGLGSYDGTFAKRPLPAIAEGRFAVPHPLKIAGSCGEAARLVIHKIAQTRRLHDRCKGEDLARFFRQSARSVEFWGKLTERQRGNDILILAAQFGLRHRGLSVHQACAAFRDDEFGLGAYETGIMLLTHPERFASCDDLWIACAGDEAARLAGAFVDAPCWTYGHDLLRFSAFDIRHYSNDQLGSASAALPAAA